MKQPNKHHKRDAQYMNEWLQEKRSQLTDHHQATAPSVPFALFCQQVWDRSKQWYILSRVSEAMPEYKRAENVGR